MNNAGWEHVKRIFNAAMERAQDERAAFLDAQCAGDDELRREVESLIHSARPTLSPGTLRTGGAAQAIANASTASLLPVRLAETAGTIIGPYKLLQVIGEGGFGTVFMAEQSVPVRRRVALKIIKLGMDTKAVVARFEAERQALALMDHPHIAKVLDGGATDTGQPFFVMDYVTGDPITLFVTAHHLTIKDRLALFAQVCAAVQHAHQKGVIHRDIKPGNVLVSMTDGKPFAKVIDFGVAKATAQPLTEKTLFTEHRQLIGTPEYMSPEQAEGSADIDTRTDVYALGVLLYELLTGLTPFDSKRLRGAAYGEMQRIIKEEEPPMPSVRLSRPALADATAATPAAKAQPPTPAQVKGDLDWIVMKALDKDRARRYDTPNALAGDVQRYLTGEAVLAAPPSAAYRLRKFVRKNRGAVITVSAVAAVVMLAAMTVIALATETRRQALLAQANAAEAQQQATLVLDAAEFAVCGSYDAHGGSLTFSKPATPGAARHLARLPHLKDLSKLSIDGPISMDLLRALTAKNSGLTKLQALFMHNNAEITDEGARALAARDTGLANLTILLLERTSITDEGIRALAAKDTGLTSLILLRIDCPRITDQGLRALATNDTGLKTMTTLELSDIKITTEGFRAMAAKDTGLTNLTRLDLYRATITDEGLRVLAAKDTGMKNLTTLGLYDTEITDEGIRVLAANDTGLIKLAELNLERTKITDKGLRALAAMDTGMKHLLTISLSGTKITGEGLGALTATNTGVKNLSTLALDDTEITDECIRALAAKDTGLNNLTTLQLSNTKITNEGFLALAARDTGLKTLTTLELHGTKISDQGLRALAANDTGLTNLTSLNLGDTEITDEGLRALAANDTGLTRMTELILERTKITDKGLQAIAAKDTGLTRLNELNLDYTEITDEGLRALAAKDTGLTNLTTLSLFHTNTTNEGVQALRTRWPKIKITN